MVLLRTVYVTVGQTRSQTQKHSVLVPSIYVAHCVSSVIDSPYNILYYGAEAVCLVTMLKTDK